jgi:hypothetical protein
LWCCAVQAEDAKKISKTGIESKRPRVARNMSKMILYTAHGEPEEGPSGDGNINIKKK